MPDAGAPTDLLDDAATDPGAVPPRSVARPGQAAAHSHGSICANCHAALKPAQRFCHDCGQQAHLHPPSAREFAHEFILHYIALEGALWRTLRRLYFSPGYLTQAWIDGRRTHFVQPLRIYLTASIIFFIALRLGAPTFSSNTEPSAAPVEAAGMNGERPPVVIEMSDFTVNLGEGALAQAIEQRLAPGMKRLGERMAKMGPEEAATFISNYVLGKASYLMFLLLPLYALLFKIAYLGHGLAYGAHVVFAFHVHAFVFSMFLLESLPLPAAIDGLPLLAVPVYILLAMRRLYRASWTGTLVRAGFISVVYGLSIAVAILLLATTVLFAV